MKKTILSMCALIALLAFTACGEDQQTPPAETNDPATQQEQEIIDEEPIPEDEMMEDDEMMEEGEMPEDDEMPDDTETIETPDYVGTWSRISSTLNGEPQEVVPSTITMTKDTYMSSTNVCTISGDLFATEDTMDIIIDSSDCPGGILTDYVNAYTISEDGETLTFTNTQFGGTMVEVYERVE
ncbi:hypothetical protein GF369_04700 [Candidatus Peregrinibacteria bacterium]|nr:hypothetical protein [Candidatus Peregrinibacteria bacterium]